MADAFYSMDGDRATPSELTRGPWDPNAQHAGPPAALLARALELCEPREGARSCGATGGRGASFSIGRVTAEILAPVPIEPLTVSARVARTRPEGAAALRFFATGERVGWHTAMEIRFARGAFLDPGPATVWMRPRVSLVEGEPVSPLQRVLLAADGGNGVSAPLDWEEFIFINTDLTVHLLRPPEGEWVCLDSVTHVDGLGMTDTALWDERGRIGRAAQTLLVRTRA